MHIKSLGFVAAVLLAATIGIARADAVYSFSFTDDGLDNFASHLQGTVSGLIFGLNADGNGQNATSAEILSSPEGITNTHFNLLFGTFDVSGGQIIGVHSVFFQDGLGDFIGLNVPNGQLGFENYLETPNGAQVTSNLGGLAGVTYAQVTSVPEPSTWAMMIAGFAVIGFTAYRKRRAVLSALG